MLLCQVVQVFYAVVVYKCIIPNRGTMGAYLVGWGAIIPTVLWLPFQLLEDWDIQNHCLKMGVAPLPMIVVFRTIEAMYDTSPPVVETSLANYVTYYTAVMHHVWDATTKTRVKITPPQLWSNIFRILQYYFLLSLSLSFMVHFDFTPFPSPVVLDEFHFNWDLIRPAHIANSYLLAGTYCSSVCDVVS